MTKEIHSARYNIINFGTPYFKFESEAVISDENDENNNIIIRSGYADIEPTLILAAQVLNTLNNGYST